MAAVARKGDRGVVHASPYTINSGSTDVLINNKPAARVGDSSTVHKRTRKSKHISKISRGSTTVFVNNKPLARVGDRLGDCTTIASGSPDVNAG